MYVGNHAQVYICLYVYRFMFTYRAIKCLSNQLRWTGPILYVSIIYITILTNIKKAPQQKLHLCSWQEACKYILFSALYMFKISIKSHCHCGWIMSHHNPIAHLQTVSTFNNPKDDTIIQNNLNLYWNWCHSNVLLPSNLSHEAAPYNHGFSCSQNTQASAILLVQCYVELYASRKHLIKKAP